MSGLHLGLAAGRETGRRWLLKEENKMDRGSQQLAWMSGEADSSP
jgi:hypothetical protein